jgi:hypothetical protein
MIYSKRRTNLGRRSKKSSNRTLKRLRGGSSSSVELSNDNDELPEGFSPLNEDNVAKWYPKGTEILKINKEGKRLHIITLPEKRILQFYDLGDRIIGVKIPTIIPSSKPRSGNTATVIRYQQQRADELEAKNLARFELWKLINIKP